MPADPQSRLRLDSIDDVTVASFTGARLVDDLTLQEVADELYALVAKHGRNRLVLNFNGVHALSSTALGIFAALKKRAVDAGGDLKLCSISGDLMLPFTATGLDKKIKIYKDEQSAIDSF